MRAKSPGCQVSVGVQRTRGAFLAKVAREHPRTTHQQFAVFGQPDLAAWSCPTDAAKTEAVRPVERYRDDVLADAIGFENG